MLNRVKPVLSTTVTKNDDGTYDYSYGLQDDPTARDPIKVWSIAMPAGDAVVSATQASWVATLEPVPGNPNPPGGTVSMSPVALATWRESKGALIGVGGTVSGFHLTSSYLPGFTVIYARSDEDYAVPANLPSAVAAQLQVMRQRDWMNKRVLGIGPRFPRAWSRDTIAADFKDGIAHLTATGDLDPSSRFVTALNAVLGALTTARGAAVPLDSALATAATPLEQTIANAVSVSLQ